MAAQIISLTAALARRRSSTPEVGLVSCRACGHVTVCALHADANREVRCAVCNRFARFEPHATLGN